MTELEQEVEHWKNAYWNSTERERGLEKQVEELEAEITRLKESREFLKKDTENRIEELKAKFKGLDFAPLETLYTGMIEECKRFLKLIGEVNP